MGKNKPLIQEFLGYIVKPTIQVEEKPSFWIVVFNVVRLWALIFLLSMFFAMVSNFMLGRAGYSEEDFAITEIVMDFPYLLVFFLVAVWAPISEEIAFRLWLRFSPLNWALGLSFFLLFAVSFLDFAFIPQNFFTLNSWTGVFSMVLFLLVSGSIIYRVLCYEKVRLLVKSFFEKRFKIFFYTLAILFAALHIANYDVNFLEIWYFAPILVFPQLFLSFTISFVRMRYGFSWAVLTHALNNVVAIIPILFLLPVLERFQDFTIGDVENMEILRILSPVEIALVMLGSMFLFMIFTICLLSLFSLLFEIIRKK